MIDEWQGWQVLFCTTTQTRSDTRAKTCSCRNTRRCHWRRRRRRTGSSCTDSSKRVRCSRSVSSWSSNALFHFGSIHQYAMCPSQALAPKTPLYSVRTSFRLKISTFYSRLCAFTGTSLRTAFFSTLFFPCFKTALCNGGLWLFRSVLLSGSGWSSLQNLQPQSWLLERPKVRAKSMQKLLGHNAALRGWSLQLGLRKIRRNGAKPPYQRAALRF